MKKTISFTIKTSLLLCLWGATFVLTRAQCPNSGNFFFFNYGTPPCGTFDTRNVTNLSLNRFNAFDGANYDISSCGSPGNTLMTVYQESPATAIAFNDDNGPLCSGSAASVNVTTNFTGVVRVYLNPFSSAYVSNCGYGSAVIGNPTVPGIGSAVLSIRQINNLVITADPASICVSGTKTLTATPASGTWSILSGGGSVSGNVYTPSTTGPVNLRYTVGSCFQDFSFGVVPNPVIAPVGGGGGTFCGSGDPAPLTANISGGSGQEVVEWYYVDGTACPSAGGGVFVGNGLVYDPPAGLTTTRTYQYYVSGTACVNVWAPNCVTTFINPAPPVAITADVNSVCTGGSANLTATGATSYVWAPGGQNTASITVSPNTLTIYTVTGTDANGCSASATVTIDAAGVPPTVSASSDVSLICNGGSANLSATGAANFTWEPGSLSGANVQVQPTISTTYTVTGTNLGGCVSTSTVTVNVDNLPSLAVTSSAAGVCSGGAVTLSATGAVNYSWEPGSLSGASVVVNPTAATTYTVTGTSALGCSSTATISINVSDLQIAASETASSICGAANGGAQVVASAGMPPYTYLWSNGETTDVISNLIAGTYTVEVSDAVGCVQSASVTVQGATSSLTLSLSIFDAACLGNSVTATVSGGTPPYFYIWSTGDTGITASNFPPGVHSFGVTDINGCLATQPFVIVNPPIITSNIVVISDASGGLSNGVIDLTVSGGQQPYSYQWSNGSTLEDPNLPGGTFTVVITDANGCTATNSVTIIDLTPPCPYEVSIPSIPCNGNFPICIVAPHLVNSGIIGLDIALTYDPALVTPLNNVSVGDVVLNSVGGDINLVGAFTNTGTTPGQVNVIIFYQAGSPVNAQLSDSGFVACLDFSVNPGVLPGTPINITASAIESYDIGINTACVEDGSNNTSTQSNLNAVVIYRDNVGFPLSYDANNPSFYNETKVEIKDANCANILATTSTDVNGQFNYQVSGASQVSISRDIDDALCPNVFPAIASFDAYLASIIATGNVNAQPNFALVGGVPTPNIFEILAADVNSDGFVTAGDVTLLQQRSVLSRCNFPGGKDWAFVNDSLISLPAFQASATYPAADGSGYDRLHVPAVPSCLFIPGSASPNCPAIAAQTYNGILIGDVDGDFSNFQSNVLRTAATGTVTIDATKATSYNGRVIIPLNIQSDEDVKALDFAWNMGSKKVYGVVQGNEMPQDLSLVFNKTAKNELLVSAITQQGMGKTANRAYYLEFAADDACDLEDLFANAKANLNGSKANVVFKSCETTSGVADDAVNSLTLYPNPTQNQLVFSLNVKNAGQLGYTLYDVVGKEVLKANETVNAGVYQQTLSLGNMAAGVYTLKVTSGSQVYIQKVVKQ